jgi:Protein of unknown function (DUF4199)
MSLFTNPNRIPESYGIKIAGGLIGYFLLMRLLGLEHHVELRLLNLVIQVVGIYYALKTFKRTHGAKINYFRALATGVSAGAIASGIFAIFLFAYMMLDSSLMDSILVNEKMGHYLNPYMIAFIVTLEGGFSGLFVTFVLINYISTDEVTES